MTLLAALVTRPRDAAAEVLRRGTLLGASLAVLAACAVAIASASRFAATTSVADIVYGPGRSTLVSTLLDAIGPARTAVVVYLLQQTWAGLVTLTAVAPAFVWALGASAIHAAARVLDRRAPFRPMLVYVGYATGLALVPSGVLGLLFAGTPLVRITDVASLAWLGWLAYRGIAAYYAVPGSRALAILGLAVTLFYLVPLLLIAAAVMAIVTAAIVLDLA